MGRQGRISIGWVQVANSPLLTCQSLLRVRAARLMQRAIDAMHVTYFHWGFHAWALYVIVGLGLANNLPTKLSFIAN